MKVLNPEVAIVPNKKQTNSPITGVGMLLIKADKLPENPNITDKTPAPQIT